MNTEVSQSKARLVLASVLAGVSTMATAVPMNAMSTETQSASTTPGVVKVSQAALNSIDARVQRAIFNAGKTGAKFLQITRGGGTFGESGPDFVQSWSGQMRLP